MAKRETGRDCFSISGPLDFDIGHDYSIFDGALVVVGSILREAPCTPPIPYGGLLLSDFPRL